MKAQKREVNQQVSPASARRPCSRIEVHRMAIDSARTRLPWIEQIAQSFERRSFVGFHRGELPALIEPLRIVPHHRHLPLGALRSRGHRERLRELSQRGARGRHVRPASHHVERVRELTHDGVVLGRALRPRWRLSRRERPGAEARTPAPLAWPAIAKS